MLPGRKNIADPVIEMAREADFAFLSKIHSQGFARGWSDGELYALAQKSACHCYVARKDGKQDSPPLAFVLFTCVEDEAEIITIATSSNHRRRGLGRKLMEKVIHVLQQSRAVSLFLEVEQDNMSAIGLYQSLGFVRIGERKAYYRSYTRKGAVRSSALVMRLELD